MKKSTHTPEYRAILAELVKVRESAGFSQRALAARLRVHPSWVAKVETGERRIDLVEFHWFVSACGGDPVRAFEQLARLLSSSSSMRVSKGGRGK
jgi:transcriptional regulator with XRE-family HTH domain